MTTLRRTAILALVVALVAIPTTAFAQEDDAATTDVERVEPDRPTDVRPDHDLREIKARALATIEKQLEALGRLRSAVANARFITEDHAAQLLRDIGAAAEGLSELARKIEAATTLEELRELIEHIGDYKIAQVLAPKTHQVIASDAGVAAARKLESWGTKLSGIIARFEEAGFDVDEAWRLLDSMKGNTSEGLRLADPVAENVIWLQSSDWPDPAEGILAQGRSDLRAARDALKAAHGNAKDIVHFLRSLIDGTDIEFDSASSSDRVTD